MLSPMLIDLRGDAWFFSTPRGYNDFFHLWERGADPAHQRWAEWAVRQDCPAQAGDSRPDSRKRAGTIHDCARHAAGRADH